MAGEEVWGEAEYGGGGYAPAPGGPVAADGNSDRSNRFGGRDRDGIGIGSWEPPVENPPNERPGLDGEESPDGKIKPRGRVIAHAFSTPVITPGRPPSYSVQSESKPDQRDRIVIGGKDVTFFRGSPTPFPGFALIEPFMFGPTTITFPQIAAAFETPGGEGLRWLKKFAPVKIQRVSRTTNEVVSTDYRGFVIGYDTSGADLTVQIGGELTGRAAMENRQVPIFPIVRDLGAWADAAVRRLGLDFLPFGGPETGIRMLGWGGGSMLEYLNQIIALSWNRTGNRWTIMPSDRGTYRMSRKDLTTIHGTVYADDSRTLAALSRDLSEEPNRIFVQGITPVGQRVRFGAYPGLQQTDRAPYPYDNTSTDFGIGTVNGDTDSGDGVIVLITRLRTMEYLDADESQNGYDSKVARAVKRVQRDADLPDTGTVDYDTWRALFDLDVTGYSLRWSRILPAAEKSKVRPWKRSSSGAIIARNPNYQRNYPKIDRNVDVGTGMTRAQMAEWANTELQDSGDDDWLGSITFNTGALVQGIHVPGTALDQADVFRARDLRPGMNLWLPLFSGGITVHVSAVTVDTARNVTATVDTRARDSLEIWEIMERNQESRTSPYRAWLEEHRASEVTKDAIIPWDEIGGILFDKTPLNAEAWKVIPIVAGQAGTIAQLRMKTSVPAEYCVAVFGSKVGERQLQRIIGNPLTVEGRRNFRKETKRGLLDGEVLLYVAGDKDAPCGYFPRTKSEQPTEEELADPDAEFPPEAPLTGRWEDDASFSYRTAREPVLYMAVWVDRACSLPAGRIMFNQLESGA